MSSTIVQISRFIVRIASRSVWTVLSKLDASVEWLVAWAYRRTVIDVKRIVYSATITQCAFLCRGAYLVSRWSRVTPLILLPYSEHNYYCSVRLHARLLTVINFWFIAKLSPSVACNQSTSFAICLTTLLARASCFFRVNDPLDRLRNCSTASSEECPLTFSSFEFSTCTVSRRIL